MWSHFSRITTPPSPSPHLASKVWNPLSITLSMGRQKDKELHSQFKVTEWNTDHRKLSWTRRKKMTRRIRMSRMMIYINYPLSSQLTKFVTVTLTFVTVSYIVSYVSYKSESYNLTSLRYTAPAVTWVTCGACVVLASFPGATLGMLTYSNLFKLT